MGITNIFSKPEELLGQEFSEDPKIKRDGKEVSIKDHVQTFKDDCEIYTLIEKYGSIKEIPMETAIIEGDISSIKNLRDIKEAEIAEKRLWEKLPLNIRKEFNNDMYDFRKNGQKWVKEQLKKEAEIIKNQNMQQMQNKSKEQVNVK